ncbi:low affinity immunoglobulin gamma Fc region receptor II isoform X2 [Larimichthys crocea]|uniref:low affinity immunoglobulin gamma Fc region receptor II isoform X2 n=1 Tax=Larimichthys crocea TaxID=215358 RepID=UPI000622DA0D|nr:low affinity immunoglobulin gamma Fc region receptor II isoform X2 [Larimichthys crocea]
MKAILLLLLLHRLSETSSAHSYAFVKTTSDMTQFFEYENISVSCEQFGSDWTVWRVNEDRVFSQCGSGWGIKAPFTCKVNITKPNDSGAYWCQSRYGDSSNTVNLTVTSGAVILQSPVLPVMEGDDVTLHCKTKNASSDLPADFYKDGFPIRTEPTGHMTIHRVSRADEGLYKCKRSDESPESWLLIKESHVASITVTPPWSQIHEYEDVNLSCGLNSSSHGWKVFKTTKQPNGTEIVGPCPVEKTDGSSSGCSVQTAKNTDGGVYWCQSPQRQRSNSVTILVQSAALILQSPVLPVMEGDNVTVHCKTKSASSDLPAGFYKDGSFIRTEPTGHMTIHRVSRADEGLYRCKMSGHGESPPSQLLVRELPTADPSRSELVLVLLRHLLLPCPYVITTVIMVSVYRQKPTGKNTPVSVAMSQLVEVDEERDQSNYDDVTTEHNF